MAQGPLNATFQSDRWRGSDFYGGANSCRRKGAKKITLKSRVFAQDNVAVVKEHEQVVGIVTKIDLIEFLAERM